MAFTLEQILSTIDGMTAIRDNVKNTGAPDAISGVTWFTYNGEAIQTIYIDGNTGISFRNSTDRDLRICGLHGTAVYYVYRQEGELQDTTKFLKFRVEAYNNWFDKIKSHKVIYEVFLFSDGCMFLNILDTPVSSVLGNSHVFNGTENVALKIPADVAPTNPLQIVVKNPGAGQEITYEKYPIPEISGIEITSLPEKLNYYQKELFDDTGISVSRIYTDGSKAEIASYSLMGFDSSEAGNKTVTVRYKEFTSTFEVEISDVSIIGIEVTTLPNKTTYIPGEALNSTGIVISFILSDGTRTETTKYKLSELNSETVGEHDITVTYAALATTFTVTVATRITAKIGTPVDEDVVGTFDAETGLLIISGTGNAYIDQYQHPFNEYRASVLDIVVESGVTNIPGFIFSGLINAKTVSIPEGITSIGGSAFNNCRSLKEIILPDGLESIGRYAFASCTLIEEMRIPLSVKSIGSNAFERCIMLTEIEIPLNTEVIGDFAFEECTALKDATVYNDNCELQFECFPKKSGFTMHVWSDSTAEQYASKKAIPYVLIEDETATGIQVTSLPMQTSYYLGEDFDDVGIVVEYVFAEGENRPARNYTLSEIDMSLPGVKTIMVTCGPFTTEFSITVSEISITGIEITNLPDKLEFSYGKELDTTGMIVSYVLSDGNRSEATKYQVSGYDKTIIGEQAITVTFKECTTTFTVTVLGTFTVGIGSPNLENVMADVNLDTGEVRIYGTGEITDREPFVDYISKIKNVVIEDGVTNLGWYLFWCADKLETVSLPETITEINDYAFSWAENLRIINIPYGVTKIGEHAFEFNCALTSITIPPKIKKIDEYVFYGCDALETVNISEGVESIEYCAFEGCSALHTINIPSTLTSIKGGFDGCLALTVLELPVTVNCLIDHAFYNCTELELTIQNAECEIEDNERNLVVKKIIGHIGSTAEAYAEKYDVPFETIEQITGIEVTKLPEKTVYRPKESIDTTGIIISLIFSDGSKRETTKYQLSELDSERIGNQDITVTYAEFTTTFAVSIERYIIWNIGKTNAEDAIATLDYLTGELRISGTGAIRDYVYREIRFWEEYADKIIDIVFESGITRPGNYLFYDRNQKLMNILSLTLSDTIENLGWESFGYLGITEIEIPPNVKDAGSITFENCDKLTTVKIQNGVPEIGFKMFVHCDALANVMIPESVTLIDYQAFYYCDALEFLELSQNIAKIDDGAFGVCRNLELKIQNASCEIYDGRYTLDVKKIIGHVGSTADTYASKYAIPFEPIETVTDIIIKSIPSMFHVGATVFKSDLVVEAILESGGKAEVYAYDLQYSFSEVGELEISVTYSGITKTAKVQVVAFKTSEICDNTNEMQIVLNNSKKTYNCDVDGVSWFVDKLIINGCGQVLFEYANNYLKICYGSGAVYYIYRIESVLENGMKFLKTRVEGYTNSDSTEDAHRLVYELFLFDNNDMFLNVIKTPTDTSYFGTSDFTRNSKTTGLNIPDAENPGGNVQVSFYHLDEKGNDWDIKYEQHYVFVDRIEITKLPNKTEYAPNEEFVPDGLEVYALYVEGTKALVTAYEISGFDSTTPGTKNIIVSYHGYEANFEVTVTFPIHIVIFKDYDGTIIKQENVLDGNSANAPNAPTRGGYEFTGWNADFSSVTSDLTVTAQYRMIPAIGIRIASYPNKIYYRIGEELDTTGLRIVAITDDGTERQVTGCTYSGFDNSTVGRKEVAVMYDEEVSDSLSKVFTTDFSVKVTAMGDNPYDGRPISVNVKVHWPNGEFQDLTNDDLKSNALVLHESICNADYFIFGGCICNRITFTTDSKQFMPEGVYPHGDIVVTVENAGTETKIFTGTIATGERTDKLTERNIVACDYLYKFQNTDISWWYKNQTVDKKPQMLLTQKQFRDILFEYLGIEQVPTKLEYDDALVPDTNIPNEMNVLSILKDLCLQNSVFGWMNRDGKYEYLKLPENARLDREDIDGTLHYEYYEPELYFDSTNYDTCSFVEGRIWYPKQFLTEPYPGVFHPGDLTAQEAYEQNVYYNRDSFFVGDVDWLDSAFQGDEYGIYTKMEPIMPICFGTTTKWDNQHIHMAQGYKMKIPRGNPLNKVGDSLEITVRKIAADGTELTWVVHSYIMSRTLKIIGKESMSDEYSAKNGPYNGNNSQIGRKTQELSSKVFTMRSEGPTISYADFSDGSDLFALTETEEVKKTRLRCLKRCKKSDYDALIAAEKDRPDTLYLTYEE